MSVTAPKSFQLRSSFKPAGDQPQAIAKLIEGLAKIKGYYD